jgi:hypothetical protein
LIAIVLNAFVPKLGTPKLPDVSQLWGDAAHGQENSFATPRPSRTGRRGFIAKQQRLIVESERDDCQDVAQAMRLLEAFLVLQQSREEHRARILDELYDVRFKLEEDIEVACQRRRLP